MLVQTIETYCDICRIDARETPTDHDAPILFEIGGKPKRVDTCLEHSNPTWQTINIAMIDDIDPDRATQPAKPASGFTCVVCGHKFNSPMGATRHMGIHNGTENERDNWIRESCGNDTPEQVLRRLSQTTPCPVEGCVELSRGAQGLRMHIRRSHPRVSDKRREEYVAAI